MAITTGQIIAKRLSLRRLDSFIEEKSILRVQPGHVQPGPFRPAAASYFNHCAPERNLPEFWLRNWTPTSYRVIRRVIRKCIRRLVEPSNPRMSSLPTVRFRAEQQQCSGSEVHFFAPLYVNVKQSTVKILSCIFTCMVTRVVHIEIVYPIPYPLPYFFSFFYLYSL